MFSLGLPYKTVKKIHLVVYLSLMIIDFPSGFFTLITYMLFNHYNLEVLYAVRAPDLFGKSNRNPKNILEWLGFHK